MADIKAAKVDKDAFVTTPTPSNDGEQIAAPTNPPPVVEQRAGGATHGSEAPPATLEELRERVRSEFSDADRQALTAYFDANNTDRTDAAQVAEAIDAVLGFHDVTTEPVERPQAQPADRPTPKVIDEGADLDAATVDAAGKRYLELPDDTRSWVSVSGARVRLNPDSGGKATERRMELLRGLCALAEAGYDSDDMARAVIAHIIGDDAWAQLPVAQLVADLTLTEARRFAAMCDALAGRADVALHYELDGRAVLSPSAIAA